MPTSLLIAGAGGLASAGGGFALSKLFGSKGSQNPTMPLQSFAPTGFNAGGLSTGTDAAGNMVLGASPGRNALVGGSQGVSGNLADTLAAMRGQLGPGFSSLRDYLPEFAALRKMVAPGVSDLRAGRLGEIEDARQRSIGDLRENLQRRRVLGSSFGQDAITRAESEFAGQRERVSAESTLTELDATNKLLTQEQQTKTQLFLQEFEANNQLINQEFTARRQAFQTGLDALNFEADIGAKLSANATNAMQKNAGLLAQLNAMEAQGQGKFFGQLAEPVGKAAGAGVGKMFAGGSPSGGSFTGLGGNPNMPMAGVDLAGNSFSYG